MRKCKHNSSSINTNVILEKKDWILASEKGIESTDTNEAFQNFMISLIYMVVQKSFTYFKIE